MCDPDALSLGPPPGLDAVVLSALAEDLGFEAAAGADLRGAALLSRDVTTDSTIPASAHFGGTVAAREELVVAGLPYAERSWVLLAELASAGPIRFEPLVSEGEKVAPGTALARIEGPASVVLGAERTALDFMMVLSGVATEARRWRDAAGEACRAIGRERELVVTDTRKTVPGMRAASKYAVAVGGACNHRAGLWDMVLVKDNHLRLAGGVAAAVEASRANHPGLPVEIEADSLEQAVEAAAAGADFVLLDNMDDAALTAAVAAVREIARAAGTTCLTEASGGITFDRIPSLAATGVDRVSTSRLTLAPPVDVGLDVEET